MGFYIKRGLNIADFEGDVIINSVGVTSPVKGAICNSILEKANSPELEEIINKVNDVYNIGDYFITDGYNLPCKGIKILHLISPDVKNDEFNFPMLKECIRRIFNECQKRQLYKVGIPLIATGWNGYDKQIVSGIIEEMADAYTNFYPNMSITLVLLDKTTYRSYKDLDNHSLGTLNKFESGSIKFGESFDIDKPIYSYSKAYFAYEGFCKGNKTIRIYPKKGKTNDIDSYIYAYSHERHDRNCFYPIDDTLQKKMNAYFAYGTQGDVKKVGSSSFYNVRYKCEAEKKQLLKIVFALKMNVNEAEHFLHFFGSGLAMESVNKVDDLVRKLLNEGQYGIVEIDLAFKKAGIKEKSIFSK